MVQDNKIQAQSWGGLNVPVVRRSLGWVVLQTACCKHQARWVVMELSQVTQPVFLQGQVLLCFSSHLQTEPV